MKILITFYYLNNLGGIINNQEGLVSGLRELGHDVTTKCLVWKDKVSAAKAQRSLEQEKGVMGFTYDQELGWTWPAHARFAYKGKWNLQRWKEYASGFDLVIWQIPVPTMQKDNRGNTDWLELYDIPVKQVGYVHDGNMPDAYPWIMKIKDKFCGIAGTHPCAYHSLKNLAVPRALAFTGHFNIKERVELANASKDRKGWLSLQTFKGWKHVDDLVRAVPYMTNDEPRILAGGGIHYYYMTSKTKMKNEYLANRRKDPDLDQLSVGQPIWNLACLAGMEYLGYITNSHRDEILRTTKYLIDPSWSKKYAALGDHPNRTPIDGIISGSVPIARNLGVATNEEGVGEFFIPDRNYIMIPWNATPKEFAQRVDHAINLPEADRLALLHEARKLLTHWDCVNVAQTFIDLAQGRPAGVYANRGVEVGVDSEAMKVSSDAIFNEFFAGETNDEDDTCA